MASFGQLVKTWLAPITDPIQCAPESPSILSLYQETVESLLKRMKWRLSQKSRPQHTGQQQSFIKGQGIDFTHLREYLPGDDIRKIDWNVFARTFTPHIRQYEEETEQTTWFVLDCSPSMFFGQTKTKVHLALELMTLIGILLNQARHRIGCFSFSGETTYWEKPKVGYSHLQALLKNTLHFAQQQETQVMTVPPDWLAQQFNLVNKLAQKQAQVILFSDFLEPVKSNWQTALGQLAQQKNLCSIYLSDPNEFTLPPVPALFNPETQHTLSIDPTQKDLQTQYQQALLFHQQQLKTHLAKLGAMLSASTSQDPLTLLWEHLS